MEASFNGTKQDDVVYTMTMSNLFNSISDNSNGGIKSCCNANCSYNGLDDCDSLHLTFLKDYMMVLDRYRLTRIVVASILFVISSVGNSIALYSVLANRRCSGNRRLSNAQVMMIHMTLADLCFTFFILPLEAVWIQTGQWFAGNVMCKILIFLKYFAMYSSSGMISVMALERMTCLLMHPDIPQQRKRMIWFVVSAWTFALLNAIPSLVLFGKYSFSPCTSKCPDHIIMQCVDFYLVAPDDLRGYYIYTMLISFFIPLLIVVISHSLIAAEITRMAVRDRAMMGRRKSMTTSNITSARNKSLMITFLIAICFLVCWGPYYVEGFQDWLTAHKNLNRKDDGKEWWMYLSLYLNPCLHPIIFAFFMKNVRYQFLIVLSPITNCFSKARNESSSTKTTDIPLRNSTRINGHNGETVEQNGNADPTSNLLGN